MLELCREDQVANRGGDTIKLRVATPNLQENEGGRQEIERNGDMWIHIEVEERCGKMIENVFVITSNMPNVKVGEAWWEVVQWGAICNRLQFQAIE